MICVYSSMSREPRRAGQRWWRPATSCFRPCTTEASISALAESRGNVFPIAFHRGTTWENISPVCAQLCRLSRSAVFSVGCRESHMLAAQSKQDPLLFQRRRRRRFVNAESDASFAAGCDGCYSTHRCWTGSVVVSITLKWFLFYNPHN